MRYEVRPVTACPNHRAVDYIWLIGTTEPLDSRFTLSLTLPIYHSFAQYARVSAMRPSNRSAHIATSGHEGSRSWFAALMATPPAWSLIQLRLSSKEAAPAVKVRVASILQ
ncbi:hypothetical protein BaRGS_00004428 [Batillaria attramentaria]|uniref:Uncharacterized protein n=1 Tax=Batillaria attramentaria TaxID=370345 RepID=A0ABD0LWV4_9CAEN